MKARQKAVPKNKYNLILDFTQAVVPRNWNVYWSWTAEHESKRDTHTCNIQLKADPDHIFMKDDSLGIINELHWTDGCMFTKISLDTDSYYDLKEVILHELAHVAEHRYTMRKKVGSRRQCTSLCRIIRSHSSTQYPPTPPGTGSIRTRRYDDHGELFERCLTAFHSRAQRIGTSLDFSRVWR